MTATQAAALSPAQRRALGEIANAQLAAQDADAATRKIREAAEKVAEQQRLVDAAKRDEARAAWLECVGEMQEHAKGFVAALERGLEAGAEERSAGAVGLAFSELSRMTRISRYLSGEFRGFLGPVAPRFGELALASFPPRPIANWTEQESKQ